MSTPVTPAIDLRKLTVAELIESLTRGDAWAWKLQRQLVATAAHVARRHARRFTPAPGPVLLLSATERSEDDTA